MASQSNGTTQYVVCNGTCECKDFPKAPSGWCKHRIAAGIVKRATALAKAKLEGTTGQADTKPADTSAAGSAPTAPLPEAPVSITLKATLHGHEVMVTLRGVDFASVKAQVERCQPVAPSPERAYRPDDTPQCPKHGAMKRSTKGKGWYCPHKLADGSWCKGK